MIAYEEVLREFDRKKVKYILVGGIAFNLLGGFRGTSDMDLLVDMSDKNLEKIVKILKKQGYYVKQPVDPIKIANKKIIMPKKEAITKDCPFLKGHFYKNAYN